MEIENTSYSSGSSSSIISIWFYWIKKLLNWCKPWEEGFKHSTYTWSLKERDEQILFMDTIKPYLSFQSKYMTSDESLFPQLHQCRTILRLLWNGFSPTRMSINCFREMLFILMDYNIYSDGLQYSFWWITIFILMDYNIHSDGLQYSFWWITIFNLMDYNIHSLRPFTLIIYWSQE